MTFNNTLFKLRDLCGDTETGISQVWFVASRRFDCSLLLVSKRIYVLLWMVTLAILLFVISLMSLASLNGLKFVISVLSLFDLAIRNFGQLVVI